jgi:UDP-GlcNAc:undecaprenyl-phosphate/decaprenyl-phosphate GlcNAc-1-phosphate transferase
MTSAGVLVIAATGAAGFALSLLLSLYLTPIFRDSAVRFGIVDRPDGVLKVQKEPVPYLGGLAVFSAVLFTVAVFIRFSDELTGLLLASSIVVLLGLIDDIGRLSPKIKLFVQGIAVLLMIKSGIRIQVAFLPEPVSLALTFPWMLVMMNGFNLIDVMDGLAGSVAAVSAAILAVVFLLQGDPVGFAVCAALVGALLGFLHFNRPPARIYLGDTGSLFLGFLLGGLALGGRYTMTNPWGWMTAIAIFAVPLFEILFLSYVRLRRGVSIFAGSRDHFGLRLRKWRLSTGQTVVASCAAAAVSGGIGLAAMRAEPAVSLYMYGSIALLFLAVGLWLKAVDMSL